MYTFCSTFFCITIQQRRCFTTEGRGVGETCPTHPPSPRKTIIIQKSDGTILLKSFRYNSACESVSTFPTEVQSYIITLWLPRNAVRVV